MMRPPVQPIILALFGAEERLTFSLSTYRGAGATAVQLFDGDGDLYTMLSVNLERGPVPVGRRFWLKSWSENEEVARVLEEQGYIAPVPDVSPIPTGFVTARMYELTAKADSATRDKRRLDGELRNGT